MSLSHKKKKKVQKPRLRLVLPHGKEWRFILFFSEFEENGRPEHITIF